MEAKNNGFLNEQGFTLVELMVALVVAVILSSAVYSVYKVQIRTSTAQAQVTEIQQNIRVAFIMVAKDLRMAGFDPTKKKKAGVVTATAGRFRFTQDITGDPVTGDSDGDVLDAGEDIDYGFPVADDADGDGIPGAEVPATPETATFGVQTGGAGGYQPIAENIERIQFYYTLKDGTHPPPPLNAAQMKEIEKVKVTILARASKKDFNYTDTNSYTLGDNQTVLGPYNDNYRRRLLISEIALRNMMVM